MNRFKQPSTWAGLAAILQALKAMLPEHALVLDGLTVVAGGVAGVVNEKGATVFNGPAPLKDDPNGVAK